MAQLENDDRFNKDRMARVMRRATDQQLAWLSVALGLEQQRRRNTAQTAEHLVPATFPFRTSQAA